MKMNTAEVMNKGMSCLVDNLGLVEAEYFISVIIREQFDYTKWQREHFDLMTPEELHKNAVEYAGQDPYTGNARTIIE